MKSYSLKNASMHYSTSCDMLNILWIYLRLYKEFFSTKLNYQNPFLVRRWLDLLAEDPVSIIRIKPNLRLDRKILNFTFASNSLGLRGPEARAADNVVLGTSFAMGFGVDCGKNWYDDLLDPQEWLNLSLPVGPEQLRNLLDTLYQGSAQQALVLYHPNFWRYTQSCLSYSQHAHGESFFSYMSWQKKIKDCCRIALKLPYKLTQNIIQQKCLLLPTPRGIHLLDANYCSMQREGNAQVFESGKTIWKDMIRRFSRALVVRIPCKQEVASRSCRHPALLRLCQTYEDNWQFFVQALEDLPQVRFVDQSSAFEIDDYLLWDGHFNPSGNARLANIISESLDVPERCHNLSSQTCNANA